MNTTTIQDPAKLQELRLKAIMRALDILLTELAERRDLPPPPCDKEVWLLMAASSSATSIGGDLATVPYNRATTAYGPDPIYAALYGALRCLGESLSKLVVPGGLDDACDTLEDMAEPPDDQFRAAVLNGAWRGVGDWVVLPQPVGAHGRGKVRTCP